MALNPGTRVGLYEVIDTLGVGGMGEVYQARDTRLQREVALKMLPDAFASDPERLARFEREAQVLASLNHPHIGALYGVEESSGAKALVLELVEGLTLADRLMSGPIPLQESLALAGQIASALEAAHEQGIVHRDLKPANIKIRPDGTVKVLDFGLAKNLAPARGSIDTSQSPTITTPAMTLAGVILGSAAYMSPEQAKGREADKRSDVWAFGCVLYEMLSGTRAFEAEDVSETLAAVLMREPDWSRLPQEVPLSVRTLLRRCLERDRRRRLGDIAGAHLAMDESLVTAREVTEINRKPPSGRPPRVAVLATAAALVGALVAGGFVWLAIRATPNPDVVRFEIAPPPKTVLNGQPLTLGISPDGRTLAFVTGVLVTEQQIWIRSLGSSAAQPLSGTERASRLLWSPDSASIVFTSGDASRGASDGRLRKIDVRGGLPITIAEFGVPGAWSKQGDILFRGRDGRLHRVREGGGESQPVTELDKSRGEILHHAALFLDDGRRFVFLAQASDMSESAIYVSSIDGMSRVKLLDGLGCARFANGHLLYQRDGTLIAQPFDQSSGDFIGAAVPLVEGLGYGALTGCSFSTSSDGALVSMSDGTASDSVLTWVDGTGRPLGRIGMEGGYSTLRRPSLSHDGRRLALTRRDRQVGSDVWIVDLERDVPTRLTTDPADDEAPVFTPDGTGVVYRSNRNGQWDLYRRGSGGVGVDEVLSTSEGTKAPTGFSPDGETLLFSLGTAGRATETWGLPMKDPSKSVALVSTGFPAGHAVFSPNGRWFAYCEGDAGADQVYVQPYPQNGTRVRLSPLSGSSPQWSSDSETVYFTRDDNYVIAVDLTLEGNELKAGVARELFQAPGTFEHRGVLVDSARKRFLVPVPREQVAGAIDVILNWPALLSR